MSDCHNYNIRWWHILVPPLETVLKLCSSYDKTYLFIISFLRLIVFLAIFILLYIRKIGLWKIFLILVMICSVSLLLTTAKTTIYDVDEPRVRRERDLQLLNLGQLEGDDIDAKQNRVLNLLDDDTVDPDVIRLEVIRTNY